MSSDVPNHPLDTIREKLRRADAHLDSLVAKVNDWIASTPYEFYSRDPYPDDIQAELELAIYVGLVHEPPAELGTILGDALHNLRGVLDHLFWALVTRSGEPSWQEARTIAFPIARSPEIFADRPGIKSFRRNEPTVPGVNCVTLDERRAIEAHQPYHQQDPASHPLAVLRDLNDRDKHRAFHPVLISTDDAEPELHAHDGQIIRHRWFSGEPLKENAHVADVWVGERGIELDIKVRNAPLAITFGTPAKSTTLDAILAIRQEVADVLTKFLNTFPATSL